jgi:hypothetical protein
MFAVRVLLGAAVVFAAVGAFALGAVITVANPLWLPCAAIACIAAALLVERKP